MGCAKPDAWGWSHGPPGHAGDSCPSATKWHQDLNLAHQDFPDTALYDQTQRMLGHPLPILKSWGCAGEQTPNLSCSSWKPPMPHLTRKRGAPGALPALVLLCTPKHIRPVISEEGNCKCQCLIFAQQTLY